MGTLRSSSRRCISSRLSLEGLCPATGWPGPVLPSHPRPCGSLGLRCRLPHGLSQGYSWDTGRGNLKEPAGRKELFSPLSQNPRASTRWECVDFEPEPAVDLDIDQRGCIVFPKSVGTDQISRISGAVTQRFRCCYHLPSPGPRRGGIQSVSSGRRPAWWLRSQD